MPIPFLENLYKKEEDAVLQTGKGVVYAERRKEMYSERRHIMIWCDCSRCESYEQWRCKDDSVKLNRYGVCKNVYSRSDGLQGFFSYIDEHFKEYPFHLERDGIFFRQLLEEFPELDVLDELKRFRVWHLDREIPVRGGCRKRFRNWLIRSGEQKNRWW